MINDDIQKQVAGDNSINTQVQGSVTIVHNHYGITPENAKEELQILFEKNMPRLRNQAMELLKERADELSVKFLEKITQQEKIIIEKIYSRLSEPAMQLAIFEAQKNYAKYGDKEKEEKLVQLLIEKGKQEPSSLKDILIDDAIEKLSKMTNSQLNILSYLISITMNYPSENIDHFYQNYIKNLLKFYNGINKEKISTDIQYLMYLGCIRQFSMAQVKNKIIQNIIEGYGGLFSLGFTKEEFVKEYGSVENNIIIKCMTNSSLWQLNFLNEKILSEYCERDNIDIEKQHILRKFYNKLYSDEKIVEKIIQFEPNMTELFDEKNLVNNYELMPLGRLIGIKNYESIYEIKIEWDL